MQFTIERHCRKCGQKVPCWMYEIITHKKAIIHIYLCPEDHWTIRKKVKRGVI